MSRNFVGWTLLMLLAFGHVAAQEPEKSKEEVKLRLAVLPFQEIGEVRRGAGEVLACLAMGRIDGERYALVERARLKELLGEKLFQKGWGADEEELAEMMKVAAVDALLVGEVSDLYQSFGVAYRVVSMDASVSPEFRDAIENCPSWGLLQHRFVASLEKRGLVPASPAAPEGRMGWHGEALPAGMSCAGERNVYLWAADGSEMVFVPAGEFARENGERAKTEAFYIDRCEVSWAQYLAFCRRTGREHLEKTSWSANLAHPAVYVSWEDAGEYCRSVGKSLPRESEWERAACGNARRLYPWGDRAAEPLPACYGKQEGAVATMPVGSFADGQSPYGCHDMAGNAAEWCLDWYREAIGQRVLRGGSWMSGARAVQTDARRGQNAAFRLNFTGFRGVVRVSN